MCFAFEFPPAIEFVRVNLSASAAKYFLFKSLFAIGLKCDDLAILKSGEDRSTAWVDIDCRDWTASRCACWNDFKKLCYVMHVDASISHAAD